MFEIFGFWIGVSILSIPPVIVALEVISDKVADALHDEYVPRSRFPSWVVTTERLVRRFREMPFFIIVKLLCAIGWFLYILLHSLILLGCGTGPDGEALTIAQHGLSPVSYVSALAEMTAPVVAWVGAIVLAYSVWSYAAVVYAKLVSMSLKVEDELND